MPTVSYEEFVTRQYKEAMDTWKSLTEEEKKLTTKPKPIEIPPELNGFSITFPDRWLIGHRRIFWENYSYKDNPREMNHLHGVLLGSIALCDTIERGNLPEDVDAWPIEAFDFILDHIYYGNFDRTQRTSLKNLL